MGCHTLFSRPITDKEFKLMKEYAPIEIYELTGDSEENINIGTYNKVLYDSLMKSYNEDKPCVHGYYWWQLGYGSSNPKFNKRTYVHNINGKQILFVEVQEYYDLFRVYNYPRKIILSRRELRRWMKKRYFELTDEQLKLISKFFKENQGGVITFG